VRIDLVTAMVAPLCFVLMLLSSPFRSKSQLEAENAALRHQLTVLRRKVRGRVQCSNDDRLFLIQLYRWFPSILKAITIARPETLVHEGTRASAWITEQVRGIEVAHTQQENVRAARATSILVIVIREKDASIIRRVSCPRLGGAPVEHRVSS